jgi:hypothetical protein
MNFKAHIIVLGVSLVIFIVATILVDVMKDSYQASTGFFANWIAIPLLAVGYTSWMLFNAWL